jgi:hypothetical protein
MILALFPHVNNSVYSNSPKWLILWCWITYFLKMLALHSLFFGRISLRLSPKNYFMPNYHLAMFRPEIKTITCIYFMNWFCRCPKDKTIVFRPINDTSFSFSLKSFQFKTNPSAQIYIHCTSHVCDFSSKKGDCDQTCGTRRRKRDVISRSPQPQGSGAIVSEGLAVVVPEGGDWLIIDEGKTVTVSPTAYLGLPYRVPRWRQY